MILPEGTGAFAILKTLLCVYMTFSHTYIYIYIYIYKIKIKKIFNTKALIKRVPTGKPSPFS